MMLPHKRLQQLQDMGKNLFFPGSAKYWERRYRHKGNSGVGSYGEKALYKAAFINQWIRDNGIASVLELGCGDGNQLQFFERIPYTGLDVSPTAIQACRRLYEEDQLKEFFDYETYFHEHEDVQKELALSLDVIYHLVEEEVFEKYMFRLFRSASRFIIIYAWDVEGKRNYHVRHRKFTTWIRQHIPDAQHVLTRPSEAGKGYCDFIVYRKENKG